MINEDKKLTIIKENGVEQVCTVLFTYISPKTSKKFIVFYPDENIKENKKEVGAALFEEDINGNGKLFEITEESDWLEIEEVFKNFTNHN